MSSLPPAPAPVDPRLTAGWIVAIIVGSWVTAIVGWSSERDANPEKAGRIVKLGLISTACWAAFGIILVVVLPLLFVGGVVVAAHEATQSTETSTTIVVPTTANTATPTQLSAPSNIAAVPLSGKPCGVQALNTGPDVESIISYMMTVRGDGIVAKNPNCLREVWNSENAAQVDLSRGRLWQDLPTISQFSGGGTLPDGSIWFDFEYGSSTHLSGSVIQNTHGDWVFEKLQVASN
jgi:hypothetical protein